MLKRRERAAPHTEGVLWRSSWRSEAFPEKRKLSHDVLVWAGEWAGRTEEWVSDWQRGRESGGENGGRSNGGHSGSSKVAGDCRRFFCGLIGDGLRVSFGPARWGLSEPLD